MTPPISQPETPYVSSALHLGQLNSNRRLIMRPGKPWMTLVAWAGLLGLGFAALARAQEAGVPSDAEALFRQGIQLARDGDLAGATRHLRQAVALAPNQARYLVGLGTVLGQQQKMQEAADHYQKALALEPNNVKVRRQLALAEWSLGRLEQAREHFQQVLRDRGQDRLARMSLGVVLASLGDHRGALTALTAVPELVQQYPQATAALAKAHYGLGEAQQGGEVLKNLLAAPGQSPDQVFAAGQLALEAQDYATAEKLFIAIDSTYEDRPTLVYHLALTRFRAGRWLEAREMLLQLINEGLEVDHVYNLLGLCYQRQAQFDQAKEAFVRSIDLNPTSESNYLDPLRMLSRQNQWRSALELARLAVSRVPDSSRIYEIKGLAETILLLTTDAIASYRRALELKPDSVRAHRGLAGAYSAAGMISEAEKALQAGIELFPRDALIHEQYGRFLLKQGVAGNDVLEARGIELLQKALTLDDRLAMANYQLGYLALQRGDVELALRHLEKAVKLEPDVSRIRYSLARTYSRLGRSSEASEQLKAFRRLKAVEERTNPGFPAVGAATP